MVGLWLCVLCKITFLCANLVPINHTIKIFVLRKICLEHVQRAFKLQGEHLKKSNCLLESLKPNELKLTHFGGQVCGVLVVGVH